MNTSPKASRAILVLGMHRSGTSATVRVINLLGAHLGDDLMPAAERNNPRGFWEHRAVVAIHEELLGALDRSWHDIRAMPDNWLSSEAASIARKKLLDLLSEEFSNRPLWAVKDPRLSRLLPLWLQVLGDINVETCVVLVLRNPVEVAQSLAARDGLASEITHLSWLQYMLEAELVSRDLVRSVITYDGLLHNWSECMLQLERELGFRWPVAIKDISDEVSEFLDASERHYRANDVDQAALPELVRGVYEAFLEKANGDASWEKIKRFNNAYQRNAKVFLGAVAETTSQLEALKRTEAQKGDEIVLLESSLVGLRAAFKEMNAQGLPGSGVLPRGGDKDVAKIYFRCADEAYSEARSAWSPHEGLRGETALKFELESLAGVDFIRFDPSEFPGEFFLSDVRINGKRLDSTELNVTAFHQDLVLGDPNGYRFKSCDEDPYLEIDIRNQAPFHDAAVLIELTCQRLTAAAELRQLIQSALQSRAADESARWSEAIETRVGGVLAPMLAQMAGDQERHTAQHEQTQDHLKTMAEAFSHVMSEHASAIASLRTQTSNLAAGQQVADEILAGVAQQLTSLSSLCELTGRQSQEIAGQQVVSLANQDALSSQLRALSEYQQRSLWMRLRYRFSKKRPTVT